MSQIESDQAFRNYFIRNLNEESFASAYLKSGLSSDLNFDNRLTPEIFREYFLVEREGCESISSKIRDLFRKDTHNLLCIESERGTGKSTFVNTMHLKCAKTFAFDFPYPYIDLTKRNSNNEYCENIISKLIYKKLDKIYSYPAWSKAFFDAAENITINTDDDMEELFLQDELKKAVDACREIAKFENYLKNHSTRVKRLPDCDIKVYLLIYLLALATMPQDITQKRETRWIIVFDGIEAYVTQDAERVATKVSDIHRFLERAFDNMGLKTSFYTKFTFVMPIRTATSLDFQNSVSIQGKNIWGAGNTKENIVKLPKSDFSIEALLKKLRFFKLVGKSPEEIEKSKLFRKCVDIVSLLVPYPNIKKYLNDELDVTQINDKRRFVEQRLLPLLNNDHRSLVDKLCELSNEQKYSAALKTIEKNIINRNCLVNYASNGKSMIVFRNIFDIFHQEKLLNKIGYSDLNDNHQPGITRTMLNFLYYKEWEYRFNNRYQRHYGGEYNGVAFDKLLDMLKPFAEEDIKQLSLVLYRISAFNAASQFPSYWTNLIVILGLEHRLDEMGFEEKIRTYYLGKDKTEVQSVQREIRNWRVKLSDAGSCFSSWASKQFEFILSRCNNELSTTALFAYDPFNNIEGTIDACNKVLSVIQTEAIEKLIDGCLLNCRLRLGDSQITCCTFENKFFDCSLFQRYQECLFIIMESINYIDRFRLYVLEVSMKTGRSFEEYRRVNERLLNVILAFDGLYNRLKEKVENNFIESEIFFEKMRNYSSRCYTVYNDIMNASNPSDIEFDCIKRLRPPMTSIWYPNAVQEGMKQAIEKAKDKPTVKRLYSIINDGYC